METFLRLFLIDVIVFDVYFYARRNGREEKGSHHNDPGPLRAKRIGLGA
jgi:hypothetical protein